MTNTSFPIMARTRLSGEVAAWTPTSPTTDGGVSPHTWHYASTDTLYQDSSKTTAVASDGDPIGASVNQGSDSHAIVQATSVNKPTYKTNILNGEPVYRGDGNDFLQGAFNGALSQPFTIFAVAKLDAASVNDGSGHHITDGDDTVNRIILQQAPTGTPDNWRLYTGTSLEGGDSDGNWNIWTGLANGASSEFWLNGVSEASGDAGTQDPDGLTIAGLESTGTWDGDIAELLIYDSNLSNADKNEIGQYLDDKYNITYTDIT